MCHANQGCVTVEIVLLITCLVLLPTSFTNDCDITIQSTEGHRNGTFQSPGWPNPYTSYLRCIYKFMGRPNERVSIRFLEFGVKGVAPRCLHDYLDIYTQVYDEEEDVLDIPLHGRYCGNDLDDLPSLLISMGNMLILGFYTNEDKNDRGFKGSYEFIDASPYVIGTPAPPDVCGQTIKSEQMPRGRLLSPTYPGMYPDNVICYYKLEGQAGQRIKFTFIDLDLYSGGEHCPFDYVKIYDGYTNEADVIGVYCGKHRHVDLYSTSEALHIEFVTKSGRVEPTRKPYQASWEKPEDEIKRTGFLAEFEISHNFVNLEFITEGHHVRGTECDQRVLSTGESNGTIKSPNYPRAYPMNVTCRYYIDGLVDKQNLEKARLHFENFDVPCLHEECDNGYVSAYLDGQNITFQRPNSKFCGHDLPPSLVTTNPRLLLVFNTTGVRPGKGFRARYHFETDYAIPGTPGPSTDTNCYFLYYSRVSNHGEFNSPRNPSNYPLNTRCIYEFRGEPGQLVRITFEKNFKVHSVSKNCTMDYIQAFAMPPNSPAGSSANATLVGQFCGEVAPGPVVTENTNVLRVVFRSDRQEVMSGFRAKYEFLEKEPHNKRCFMNTTRRGGGVIHSPNHPHKYPINKTCDWHFYSLVPEGRILIQITKFYMEGNPVQGEITPESGQSAASGCANAILKIYANSSGKPTYELCGQDNVVKQVISQGNYLKIRFISSSRAVGAKGFTISWTELLPISSSGYCNGFKCKINGHCIDASLRCNNQPNCGTDDDSDEEKEGNCGNSYSDHGVLHVILGVVVAIVILIFLLVCILHRRRKARKKKNKKEIEVRYVTRGGGGLVRDPRDGGPRSDQSLLKERTEKVSIV